MPGPDDLFQPKWDEKQFTAKAIAIYNRAEELATKKPAKKSAFSDKILYYSSDEIGTELKSILTDELLKIKINSLDDKEVSKIYDSVSRWSSQLEQPSENHKCSQVQILLLAILCDLKEKRLINSTLVAHNDYLEKTIISSIKKLSPLERQILKDKELTLPHEAQQKIKKIINRDTVTYTFNAEDKLSKKIDSIKKIDNIEELINIQTSVITLQKELTKEELGYSNFHTVFKEQYNVLSTSQDKKTQSVITKLATLSLEGEFINRSFFIERFIHKLELYIGARKKLAEKEHKSLDKHFKSFFGHFTGFSAKVKIDAAEKLIDLLKNPGKSVTFSEKELLALREKKSNLGNLITEYEKLNLLPEKFLEAEKTRQTHEFLHYHKMK